MLEFGEALDADANIAAQISASTEIWDDRYSCHLLDDWHPSNGLRPHDRRKIGWIRGLGGGECRGDSRAGKQSYRKTAHHPSSKIPGEPRAAKNDGNTVAGKV